MDQDGVQQIASNNFSLILPLVLLGLLSYALLRVYKSLTTGAHSHTLPTEPMSTPETPVTAQQLADATGESGKPVFIAVKDPFGSKITVFDVSAGRDFYGPGGPYHLFAGKNATCGLAKSSLDPQTITGDVAKLSESEKDTHIQWHAKYSSKYPVVGYLVSEGSTAQGDTESITTTETETKKDA